MDYRRVHELSFMIGASSARLIEDLAVWFMTSEHKISCSKIQESSIGEDLAKPARFGHSRRSSNKSRLNWL